MNFIEALKAKLEENGLFKSHSEAIMKLVLEDKENFSTMQGRWRDQVEGYPPGLVNILFSSIHPTAYKWICENIPTAWFRVAFSPGIQGLEGQALDDYIKNYQRDKQHTQKALAERYADQINPKDN